MNGLVLQGRSQLRPFAIQFVATIGESTLAGTREGRPSAPDSPAGVNEYYLSRCFATTTR